ncbi:MAG: MBL fold metallo-hydrolase [Rhodospirillales bacterium]|nr:MBL fold metallo-hydrolase [Rhodospirillales bacterium]
MPDPATDPFLSAAIAQVDGAATAARQPRVTTFFDADTATASHVVRDPGSDACAIIDSVLDFDAAAGRTATKSAERIIEYVRAEGLRVEWLLETHVHADHLSAAPVLHRELGGTVAIGAHIRDVQSLFAPIFDAEPEFARDGSQFGRLLHDGERFSLGGLPAIALHTPGHTPACMTYVIGDAAFVGDTLFMPDYGTARADFPGGDARALYRSIRRVLALPGQTRIFLCHDYLPKGRSEICWETTVAAERAGNVHAHEGVSEEDFVAMRTRRDAELGMPRLILPSVQVNMRAGDMPPPAADGNRYLKIPLNRL